MKRKTPLVLLALLSAAPVCAQIPGATYTPVVTAATAGETPAGSSSPVSLSANGRYLLFSSRAPNVLVGQSDPNGDNDLFLRDLVTGTTQLVTRSFSSPLRCSAGRLSRSVMTPDGRFVLFASDAADILAPGLDINLGIALGGDLFEFDRTTGQNTLISSRWDDPTLPSELGINFVGATPDRRFLLIDSASTDLVGGLTDTNGTQDVFLFDRLTGTRKLISHAAGTPTTTANFFSSGAGLSADGRYVLILSTASNLVPGFVTNNRFQLFRYDTVTQTAVLVSHAAGNPVAAATGEASFVAAMSPDGRWILFSSTGTDVVTGQIDTNTRNDLFLFDANTGSNLLVNHLPGQPATTPAGTSSTFAGSLTADGRYVVYHSAAPDLVAGVTDTNDTLDGFLFDRTTGLNQLLSHVPGNPLQAANGATSASFAGDRRFIRLTTTATDLGVADANGVEDIYLYDATTGTGRLVSHSLAGPLTTGNALSRSSGVLDPVLDTFLFSSQATDLVAGIDDQNLTEDLFAFQLSTGAISALSGPPVPIVQAPPPLGTHQVMMSANGRFVVFTRLFDSTSPAQLWRFDRHTNQTVLVSHAVGQPSVVSDGDASPSFVSDDGRYVIYSSDATNLVAGFVPGPGAVFLYDHTTGQNELLTAAAGQPNQAANGSCGVDRISPDGRYFLIRSTATDLLAGFVPSPGPPAHHLFLRDRVNGTTLLVDQASGSPLVAANGTAVGFSSPDGRYVVFNSSATNLVPGQVDTNGNAFDAFLYDRVTGTTELLSQAHGSPNTTANGFTVPVDLSADGRFVLLTTGATNLAPGITDLGSTQDVYLRDRQLGTSELISHEGGAPFTAAGSSIASSVSDDGRRVLFESSASTLVPTTPPVSSNVYLYDRATHGMTRVSASAYDPLDGGAFTTRAHGFSASGHHVLFSSPGSTYVFGFVDLNGGENDLFLYDHGTGQTRLVSHPPAAPDLRPGSRGIVAAGFQQQPLLSSHGNVITFLSPASDFLLNDTNSRPDTIVVSTEIFVDGFESGNAARWSVVVP